MPFRLPRKVSTKPLLPLFIILGALTLEACCNLPTNVAVNDHILYYQKQASDTDWAVEMHFLTDGTRDLSKSDWQAISEGQVCMPLSDWTDINKTISAFCSAQGITCDYQVKQALNAFFLRLALASGHEFQQID